MSTTSNSRIQRILRVAVGALATLGGIAQARDATLGLHNDQHLMKNGVAVGFLPAYGEVLGSSTAASLNARLPKPMGIVGAYAEVRPRTDANLTQLNTYINDILSQPKPYPVFNLALMATSGLGANFTQSTANAIAARMKQINDMGIPIWLRFCHEMNGDWYAYGQKPDQFQAAWKMLADTIHAQTVDTYMFWAPNSAWADLTAVVGGWTPYWPTDASTVDIVGLSYYHYGGHDRQNLMPAVGEAQQVLGEFDRMFGSGRGKPVVLAETAASYTFDITTNTPATGGGDEWAMKTAWIEQITNIHSNMTSYIALCWFEVIKDENAGQGTDIKREDFRMISGLNNVTASVITYLQDPVIKTVPFVATYNATALGVPAAGSTTNSTSTSTRNVTAASATVTKSGALPAFASSMGTSAQIAVVALVCVLSAVFSS